MEEERRRGEPGPVLAPSQFEDKKLFPRLWLGSLTPPEAEWGFAPEPGWGSTPRPLLGL